MQMTKVARQRLDIGFRNGGCRKIPVPTIIGRGPLEIAVHRESLVHAGQSRTRDQRLISMPNHFNGPNRRVLAKLTGETLLGKVLTFPAAKQRPKAFVKQ